MGYALPVGWKTTEFEDCVDILDSKRVPINGKEREQRINGKDESELIPYYGATGKVGFIDDYIFDQELLILGEDGVQFFEPMRQKAYMIKGKSWVNNHAHVLNARAEITSNRFLRYYLNQFDYHGYVTGTTRLKLNQTKMKTIPVKMPPLPEQKRIADKLDCLLAKVDACKARLDKVPEIIKRFRQSVLADATSGKLTEDWRVNCKQIPVKSNLLELPEQLRGSHLNVFNDTQVHQIPDSWTYVPLINLGELVGGGTPMKSKKEYWTGDIPWISAKDMKVDHLYTSKDYINQNAIDNSSAKLIPSESLIFVVRGMILKHTFPVALSKVKLTINQDLKAFVPNDSVDNEYLFLAMRSIAWKILFYIGEATHGTLKLETPLVKTIAIPLPPVNEQKEIVKRVEALFSVADQMEEKLKRSQGGVDKLTASILAKAFRGELVPQDPDDELAEKMQT